MLLFDAFIFSFFPFIGKDLSVVSVVMIYDESFDQ